MWKHQNNFRNLFKVSNKDTRMTGAFVNCERISHIVVMFLLQTLNKQITDACSASHKVFIMGKLGLIFFALFFDASKRLTEATWRFIAFLTHRKLVLKKSSVIKTIFVLAEMLQERYIFLHFSQNIYATIFFATILTNNLCQNCSDNLFSLKSTTTN